MSYLQGDRIVYAAKAVKLKYFFCRFRIILRLRARGPSLSDTAPPAPARGNNVKLRIIKRNVSLFIINNNIIVLSTDDMM